MAILPMCPCPPCILILISFPNNATTTEILVEPLPMAKIKLFIMHTALIIFSLLPQMHGPCMIDAICSNNDTVK